MHPAAICLIALFAGLIAGLHSANGATGLSGNPWTLHIIDSTSAGADGVRLGDLNGDGLPDIATGWEEGGLVRVYLHPGHRRSGRPWPLVTVGTVADVEDAVFADLDGDGRLEVVSSCEGDNRAMYLHSFEGETGQLLDSARWRTQKIEQSRDVMQWMFCTPSVLELGGELKLAAGGKNGNAAVGIFSRPENGGPWRWTSLAAVGWVMSIRALDMDGDSDTDILFTDRRGPERGVRWLENPAGTARRWRNHLIGGSGCEVMFLDTGDLDGDGRLELAVAAKPDKILIFDREGRERWRSYQIAFPANTGWAKAVAIADFDLDGRSDLVVSCENAVGCSGVFWIRTSGWPDPGKVDFFDIAGPRGIKFDRLECLDLDGDGDPDVLTTDERDGLGVIWYENPIR